MTSFDFKPTVFNRPTTVTELIIILLIYNLQNPLVNLLFLKVILIIVFLCHYKI
jgi:hypothetical protein